MFSKPLAVGLLAAGCVTAAAGGAYVAVRQNAGPSPDTVVSPAAPAPAPSAEEAVGVAETEAIVAPSAPSLAPARASAPAPRRTAPKPARERVERETPRPASPVGREDRTPPAASAPAAANDTLPVPASPENVPAPVAAVTPELPDPPRHDPPAEPPAPILEELVVPAASVIGLQVESPVTSERAQVEDRVEARVTRDVVVDGRTAIPAGSRALGNVTVVEPGGKVRERARLGVRFHTLVLADGTRLPITTEAIFREGDSPAGESARKIGGAAVGGAIIGAIIGGKKGAVVGGATGAAGGTAVVMTGGRNAATLPAGTIVTVRLSAPVVMEVEKQPQ